MTEFDISPTDDRATARLVFEELLWESPSVDDLLTQAAFSAVAGSDRSCGITFATRYGVLTVASSDARTSAVDEIQYTAGDGPCLAAMRTGEPVAVDDVSSETRWGDYPQLASEAGVRSSLSYPLLVDGRPAGALNLYSPRAGPWTAADDAVVLLLAYQLTGIVQAVKNLAAEVELDPESAQALADRPRLDIATGILMSRYACPESDARTLLHADAERRDITPRQAADDLINEAST